MLWSGFDVLMGEDPYLVAEQLKNSLVMGAVGGAFSMASAGMNKLLDMKNVHGFVKFAAKGTMAFTGNMVSGAVSSGLTGQAIDGGTLFLNSMFAGLGAGLGSGIDSSEIGELGKELLTSGMNFGLDTIKAGLVLATDDDYNDMDFLGALVRSGISNGLEAAGGLINQGMGQVGGPQFGGLVTSAGEVIGAAVEGKITKESQDVDWIKVVKSGWNGLVSTVGWTIGKIRQGLEQLRAKRKENRKKQDEPTPQAERAPPNSCAPGAVCAPNVGNGKREHPAEEDQENLIPGHKWKSGQIPPASEHKDLGAPGSDPNTRNQREREHGENQPVVDIGGILFKVIDVIKARKSKDAQIEIVQGSEGKPIDGGGTDTQSEKQKKSNKPLFFIKLDPIANISGLPGEIKNLADLFSPQHWLDKINNDISGNVAANVELVINTGHGNQFTIGLGDLGNLRFRNGLGLGTKPFEPSFGYQPRNDDTVQLTLLPENAFIRIFHEFTDDMYFSMDFKLEDIWKGDIKPEIYINFGIK